MIIALTIDDYPATRTCVRRALMDMFDYDIQVVDVSSAPEAISMLRSLRFDIIISDLDLGTSNGAQVVKFLREEQPHMLDRLILFTGEEGAAKIHRKVIDKKDADKFAERLIDLLQDVSIPDIEKASL